MRPATLVLSTSLLCAILLAQPPQVRPLPPLTAEPVGSLVRVAITGRVTDSMCSRADHKAMGMGDTDAECTRACVDTHGALYVLFDGKDVFALSDQRLAEKFAGQRVTVRGQMSRASKTIYADAMVAAPAAKGK